MIDTSNIFDMMPDGGTAILQKLLPLLRPGGAVLARWTKTDAHLAQLFRAAGLHTDEELNRRLCAAEPSMFIAECAMGFK